MARRLTDSSAYGGTVSQAAATGRTFTRDQVTASRVGVMVTACPTCGGADVWLAGSYLGRISAYSPTTLHRQVRWLPWTAQHTGDLQIRTRSVRPLPLDGIVTLR